MFVNMFLKIRSYMFIYENFHEYIFYEYIPKLELYVYLQRYFKKCI